MLGVTYPRLCWQWSSVTVDDPKRLNLKLVIAHRARTLILHLKKKKTVLALLPEVVHSLLVSTAEASSLSLQCYT